MAVLSIIGIVFYTSSQRIELHPLLNVIYHHFTFITPKPHFSVLRRVPYPVRCAVSEGHISYISDATKPHLDFMLQHHIVVFKYNIQILTARNRSNMITKQFHTFYITNNMRNSCLYIVRS
jgi:hypothetical protein